jgi:predicted MFS family arabinose efflux permease
MKLLRTVVANPGLARLELAWATASLANWSFSILLALYAYRQGGAGAVALALIVRMVPSGLAAPYAALLVDRHPRRAILLWSAALRTVALLAAAAAAAVDAPLGVVLVFAAAFSVVATAHRPAQGALMPQLARSPTELAAANAFWTAIDYVGFLFGSLLAGVLVTLTGLDVAVAACAVPAALTAFVVRGLPADRPPTAAEERPGGFAELSEGVRTIWRHPELRVLTGLYTADALVQGIFDVLLVVAAIELLGVGESGVGWLNAAWGVGGVVGGAAALVLLGRGRLASGLSAGLAAGGLCFLAIGAWPEPALAPVLLLLMGGAFVVAETALVTLNQRLAAGDVLGRVLGVEETIDVAALGLGSLLAAALVAVLDVQGAMIAAGAVLPLVALLTARRLAGSEAGAPVPEREFGLVRGIPIFAPLPLAMLENLALRLTERRYGPGATIVTQGEPGDAFFVIADGEVAVDVDGAARPGLRAGDFFGEIALLRDVPRTATVTAVGDVTALALERDDFLEGISAHSRSARAADAIARERLDRVASKR